MKYVSILLDASGSMSGQEKRVVTGINEYLDNLKEEMADADCELAITMFSSGGVLGNRFPHQNKPTGLDHSHTHYQGQLADCPKLEDSDYQPGGMTPLFDAVGTAITELTAKKKKEKVLVIIDTDGMENTSQEYNKEQIQALIKKKEGKGWAFVFLATGIDEASAAQVSSQAAAMGATTNMRTVTHGARGQVYSAMSVGSAEYLSGDRDNTELLKEAAKK